MSSIEWTDVASYLTGFAHLATVCPNGDPHVAKVAPAVEDDVIWIATRASSRKARNVAAHPRAALMFEPAAEAYVRADVELVDDLAERDRIWHAGLFPFPLEGFFGSYDHPDFVLLHLRPTSAIVMAQGDSGLVRLTWRA